ncbi:hypothetical protein [Xanthomonas phage BUDD]|nr:hypothetical protein [Xanthomonas phage BUDD]
MFVDLFGGYLFLDREGCWVRKRGGNIREIECYSKDEAERRLQDYIDAENAYQAYKNNARDMGKAVK